MSEELPEEFLNLSENKQRAALELLKDRKTAEGASKDSPRINTRRNST